MAESWRSRVYRWGFNLFPAYRGTGARITYIADDWREVRVKLALTLRTRNYVGTIFGGSMYGAVDPIYMIMLIHCLGSDYIVWDKAATIRFKKPGRSTLYAHFTLDAAELAAIRSAAEAARSIDRIYTVELKDAAGIVHAVIEKTLYIRRKGAGRDESRVETTTEAAAARAS
jgi:acyl-coenzyme A thioesterase PaaI-like protein